MWQRHTLLIKKRVFFKKRQNILKNFTYNEGWYILCMGSLCDVCASFLILSFPKHFHFHNYHAWLGPTHHTYSQGHIETVYIRKIYRHLSQRWSKCNSILYSETHNKRQEMRHDCLHSLLGEGDKWSEIVCGEEKIYFVLSWLEQAMHKQAQLTDQEGPLAYELYSTSPHLPQF
jgi:hypothetical protein